MTLRYQMVIQWSDEDNCYLVHLPEFSNELQHWRTHGDTYEEAAKNGREVLEMLIEDYQVKGESLPQPETLQHA